MEELTTRGEPPTPHKGGEVRRVASVHGISPNPAIHLDGGDVFTG